MIIKNVTISIKDGKATFKIPGLKPGRYDVKVYYSGNSKYYSAKTTNSFKVTQKHSPNNTNTTKIHHGIDLTKNPTGNPLFVLVLLLVSCGALISRRFKDH